MSTRTTFSFVVTIDRDPIPGAFHDADYTQRYLESVLGRSIPHYNPKVERIDKLQSRPFVVGDLVSRIVPTGSGANSHGVIDSIDLDQPFPHKVRFTGGYTLRFREDELTRSLAPRPKS